MNYADAGYAAKRIGLNQESIDLFEHSLDADENEHTFDAQHKFGYRREVEQLQRSWGFVLSAPYQSAAFGPQGTISVLQPGVEVYWQPPKIGYQNGRIFQFFVRGYGTAYDGSGNTTGLPTVQGFGGRALQAAARPERRADRRAAVPRRQPVDDGLADAPGLFVGRRDRPEGHRAELAQLAGLR